MQDFAVELLYYYIRFLNVVLKVYVLLNEFFVLLSLFYKFLIKLVSAVRMGSANLSLVDKRLHFQDVIFQVRDLINIIVNLFLQLIS